jgi:hypothetical protein
MPSDVSKILKLTKQNDAGLYQYTLTVDEQTPSGIWRPKFISIEDTNDNEFSMYNNQVTSYWDNSMDLSALNFEVVEVKIVLSAVDEAVFEAVICVELVVVVYDVCLDLK